MIRFLFKGVIRDKARSRLPIIIVTIGVVLTITLSSFVTGIMRDMIDLNAHFKTGHVKVMTRSYAENQSQLPIDLAILGVDSLRGVLESQFPDMNWVERIPFGGLMDIPDENGETRGQGPVSGLAIDLFSNNSQEVDRLSIPSSLQSGRLPEKSREALISHNFAQNMNVKPGDEVTFFGSTMYGSMTFYNFKVTGTVSFGNPALDRGGLIIDISDARSIFDMQDGASEILGYFEDDIYDHEKADEISSEFNARFKGSDDEFAPVMKPLKQQNQLASIIDTTENMNQIFIFVFVLAMSIVLWNTGLLGGLRRYKEFGVRLALGERKTHIYKTMIYEAFFIGLIGSIIGTALGLAVAYPLQEYGLYFGDLMKNSSMMMPNTYRALITPGTFYIGLIPGLFAMILGQALSGIGIYKRETARLFKELEV